MPSVIETKTWIKELIKNARNDRASLEAEWQQDQYRVMGVDTSKMDDVDYNTMNISKTLKTKKIIYNAFEMAINYYKQRLLEGDDVMQTIPASMEEDDINNAKACDKFLLYHQIRLEFVKVKALLADAAFTTGTAFCYSFYNPGGGSHIEINEENADGKIGKFKCQVCGEQGRITINKEGNVCPYCESPIEAEPIILYAGPEGDIDCRILTSDQVLLDPSQDEFKNCRWFSADRTRSIEEMKELHPDKKDQIMAGDSHGLYRKLRPAHDSTGQKDTITVTEFWYRPGVSKKYPNGIYAILAGEALLKLGDWPYTELRELPISPLYDTLKANCLYGNPRIREAAIPTFEYNELRKDLSFHVKQSAGWLLNYTDNGVTDDDLHGRVLHPNSPERKPDFMPGPNLPAEHFQNMSITKQEIDDILGIHESSRGYSGGEKSGKLFIAEAQKDQDMFSVVRKLANTITFPRIARHWLLLAKEFYSKERMYRLLGTGSEHEAFVFNHTMVPDDVTVLPITAPTMASMNRFARMQTAQDIVNTMPFLFQDERGAPDRTAIAKFLELGIQNASVVDPFALERNHAETENKVMMEKGIQIPVHRFDDHKTHMDEHIKECRELRMQILVANENKVRELAQKQNIIEMHQRQHLEFLQQGMHQQTQAEQRQDMQAETRIAQNVGGAAPSMRSGEPTESPAPQGPIQ